MLCVLVSGLGTCEARCFVALPLLCVWDKVIGNSSSSKFECLDLISAKCYKLFLLGSGIRNAVHPSFGCFYKLLFYLLGMKILKWLLV